MKKKKRTQRRFTEKKNVKKIRGKIKRKSCRRNTRRKSRRRNTRKKKNMRGGMNGNGCTRVTDISNRFTNNIIAEFFQRRLHTGKITKEDKEIAYYLAALAATQEGKIFLDKWEKDSPMIQTEIDEKLEQLYNLSEQLYNRDRVEEQIRQLQEQLPCDY